jgi:predicted GIY-YIG superfamily endonuclease
MANQDSETYPFTFEAVREKGPSASGVYRIHTAQRWVYVGESDDLRRRLFQHLNQPSAAMNRFGPLSLSFELIPAADRKNVQKR